MAFHKQALGRFADGVPCDDAGYVPEDGDHWTAMHWPEGATWTEEAWLAFKQRAAEYVASVQQHLIPSV